MKPFIPLIGFVLALAPAPGFALSAVSVRVGDHPSHSRVVFDWPRPTGYSVQQEDAGRVLVRFPRPAAYDLDAARPARNVRSIEADGQTATILSVPGVRVRHFRLGGRVVVDLAQPDAGRGSVPVAAAAGLPAAIQPAVARPAEDGQPPLVLAQSSSPLAQQRRPAQGQMAQAPAAAPQVPAVTTGAPTPVPLRIESGTGRLVTLPGPAATVMAADPRVVRVQPSSPTSIFLMAGAPGRTNLIAVNDNGQAVVEYEVTVVPPGGVAAAPGAPAASRTTNTSAIEGQLRALIPGPGSVRVRAAGRQLVLSGNVPTAADARRAEAIVRGMAEDDVTILNEIGVLASVQVNLRVRVAEISREITRQFGFNWQVIGQSGNFAFGLASGTAGFPAAIGSAVSGGGRFETGLLAAGTASSTQRVGVGYSSGGWDVNALVDALAVDNLVTILAEPNLTAQSGEVASFLAGGEFPVPVSAGNNGQIGIEFKAFGVSLSFVPTVMSNDRLNLRVRPEVSELSDQGAISVPIQGGSIRIPALTVRRAETTVELGSGQSFAIAGLLQRSSQQSQEGINGLVDIPVLGALFRSDRFQRRETELVIIVTPYLVQPTSDPAALQGPTDVFRPATSLERILMQRQITATPRPVPGVPQGVGFRLN